MANFNPPGAVAQAIIDKVGVGKCNIGVPKAIIMGILAGVYIAFGAGLATKMFALVGDTGVGILIGASGFSVGLMLVVIAGAELFTGNNLMLMSVLDGKAKMSDMLVKWVIVYFANFVGSLLLVFIMWQSGLVSGKIADKAIKIAESKVALSFMAAMMRGILCNWLVCLAVWLAVASHDVIGKIFACFFPIMAFVASGFEHSIANMYFIPMGMILSPDTVSMGGFMGNLIPVTIGNIIGGAGFVSIVYWLVFSKFAPKK